MQPGSEGGGSLWPGEANAARPDSVAAATRISHGLPNDEWQRKGATLSGKTARQEFGLTGTRSTARSMRARCSTAKPICKGTRG